MSIVTSTGGGLERRHSGDQAFISRGKSAEEIIYTKDETAIAQIDDVIDLVQEHIVAKFPTAKPHTMIFRDPDDLREWEVRFGMLVKHNGRIQDVRLQTNNYNRPESFDLHNIRNGEDSAPVSSKASHILGELLVPGEDALGAAISAEARLRSILGLPVRK